ncbi:polysaccharide deacetylase family protein [Streptomyces sp. RPT161]|uniref:polysaccharide deacetylase family protein n=1 Tax=Streptomyces sp. RPT161 TaxID=3015993 RepID=UPI0022B9133B|nr:polysaccharide deacetylase family protein [Streptomyces sp. RPT161]
MTPFPKAAKRTVVGLVVVAAALTAFGTAPTAAAGRGRAAAPAVRTGSAEALSEPARPINRLRALFGSENRTMPTQRRVVALTFNAAWDVEGVDTTLDVLRRYHVPATFFLTGDFADRHPAAARAIAAAGYGIGNHSYSHPHFETLRPGERAAEVLRADHAIRTATGTTPLPFFRFPYGDTTPQEIGEVNALGFADIEWTTDTNGYRGPRGGMSVRKVVQRALDALRPGEIIQMHVGSDGQSTVLDADALPQLVEAIRAHGYDIVDLRGILDPTQKTAAQ